MMAGMTKSTAILYGIRNCDTIKKARLWLHTHAVEHVFHDYKLMGVPAVRLDQWLKIVPWESLLNRQGNTWRTLDDTTRNSVTNASGARAVMLAHPSAIKRPVMEWSGDATRDVTVGFKTEAWTALLDQRP
jgi:Spx/MgsR family transcriptional regulator